MICVTTGYSKREQRTFCGESMKSHRRYITEAEALSRAVSEDNQWYPYDVCPKCMEAIAAKMVEENKCGGKK